MKLLMFLARDFRFRPFEKMIPDVDDSEESGSAVDAAVVFIHTEESDVERESKVVTKAAKNIKWLCGKVGYRNVVLHSFNHLATSKAPPVDARRIIDRIDEKLTHAEFNVVQTPFGYVCEWDLSVIGPSIGKVYKEL